MCVSGSRKDAGKEGRTKGGVSVTGWAAGHRITPTPLLGMLPGCRQSCLPKCLWPKTAREGTFQPPSRSGSKRGRELGPFAVSFIRGALFLAVPFTLNCTKHFMFLKNQPPPQELRDCCSWRHLGAHVTASASSSRKGGGLRT